MNNLQSFKFLENTDSIKDSNVLANPNQGSQLILQVKGDATSFQLYVKGLVDNENEEYVNLAIINNSNFEMKQYINSNGIYTICVDGISKVYISLGSVEGGTVSVFGKIGA